MVVILLNGPGSVGKTALARALQDVAVRPVLHVEMDRVLTMLPERFQEDPQLVAYRTGPQGVTVEGGAAGRGAAGDDTALGGGSGGGGVRSGGR